ncbi:PREDICTED: transcription initiation factor TFIID subunit 7-like [Ceratosolen solmsi marchali]|uniref:Transcription initiation factor TFIID subunit 7-like n=1 Tax=Ceratosolen solmsi marchali TaxID=326594 RepID=A0AAJ6YJL5_9HYME|nr:PREDICTED: transcription initiation factor TFIID subunit 7-like [Ceratosolen solmsi marchali]
MQRQEAEVGGSPEVRILLSRHKASLLRELEATNLLGVLLKRGVITEVDRQALVSSGFARRPNYGRSGGDDDDDDDVDDDVDVNGSIGDTTDVDLFIELIQAKGFEAFREFCFALEAECPHVLTDLLVDQHALTGQSSSFGQSNYPDYPAPRIFHGSIVVPEEHELQLRRQQQQLPPSPPLPPPPLSQQEFSLGQKLRFKEATEEEEEQEELAAAEEVDEEEEEEEEEECR